MNEKWEVPKGSCRYEMYDLETLIPSNDSTRIRLIECNWDRAVFDGKTVLDIGCNSGALSVFAARNGASSVLAVDVQPALLDFVDQVQKRHDLKITTKRSTLASLNPQDDIADVVLCMEVLHWVVHQGGDIPTAISQLAALTKETLYVETPWDVSEPSIADRPEYPFDKYNIETIIRELSRHFAIVQIEKFMTYFGKMENSKRVLIKAQHRRTSSLGARHIQDANLVGISLGRGVNESQLVTSRGGPKVLKTIPENSVFVSLTNERINELCGFLSLRSTETFIVAPEKLGDNFVQKEVDGKTYMLFPFVGELDDYFPSRRTPKAAKEPLAAAARVSRHFASAPLGLVEAIRGVSKKLPYFDITKIADKYYTQFSREGLIKIIEESAEIIKNYDQKDEISLIHFDLQLGNFVRGAGGRDYVVDLDLIRSGPLYSDLFSCAIYTGATAATLETHYHSIAEEIPRKAMRLDIAFAITSSLLWLHGRTTSGKTYEDHQFATFINGMKGLNSFAEKNSFFDL